MQNTKIAPIVLSSTATAFEIKYECNASSSSKHSTALKTIQLSLDASQRYVYIFDDVVGQVSSMPVHTGLSQISEIRFILYGDYKA